MSESRNQVALPPVPLPQFASEHEFSRGGVGLFNTTVDAIVDRINALSPVNPNIALKVQFRAQFRADDFEEEELRFINTQLTSMVNNTNALSRDNLTGVEAVPLVQLKNSDFKKPGIPEVCQFLTAIITRLNTITEARGHGE